MAELRFSLPDGAVIPYDPEVRDPTEAIADAFAKASDYKIDLRPDPKLRATTSGAGMQNVEATLRRKLSEGGGTGFVQPIMDKNGSIVNYLYQDDTGNYRFWNPPGVDIGDVTAAVRPVAEGGIELLGALGPGGPAARATVAGLRSIPQIARLGKQFPRLARLGRGGTAVTARGATGVATGQVAREAYTEGAKTAGLEDVRTPEQRAKDAMRDLVVGTAIEAGTFGIGTGAKGLLRKVFRKGPLEESLRRTKEFQEQAFGAEPTAISDITGSETLRAAEVGAGRTAAGARPALESIERFEEQSGREFLRRATPERLGVPQPMEVIGQRIQQGVTGRPTATGEGIEMVGGSRQSQQALRRKMYGPVDAAVPGDTPIIDFQNLDSVLQGLRGGTDADVRVARQIQNFIRRKIEGQGSFTIGDLDELRRVYGQGLGSAKELESLSKETRKKIYKALNADEVQNIRELGGEEMAGRWEAAQAVTRGQKEIAKISDPIVAKPTPEAAFINARNALRRGDVSGVRDIVNEMPFKTQQTIRGDMLADIATDNNRAFSMVDLRNSWRGKPRPQGGYEGGLTPEAKEFLVPDETFRRQIDDYLDIVDEMAKKRGALSAEGAHDAYRMAVNLAGSAGAGGALGGVLSASGGEEVDWRAVLAGAALGSAGRAALTGRASRILHSPSFRRWVTEPPDIPGGGTASWYDKGVLSLGSLLTELGQAGDVPEQEIEFFRQEMLRQLDPFNPAQAPRATRQPLRG